MEKDKHCIVDIKSTTKDKWLNKKTFYNHIRYKEIFGHEFIDEYIRVKIEIKVHINNEDVESVKEYFKDANKIPKYPIKDLHISKINKYPKISDQKCTQTKLV